MAYGLRIWDGATPTQNVLLDVPDRSGQIAYTTTVTAAGGTLVTDLTTTTTNLPSSFNSAGVTPDSEVVVLSSDSKTRAYLVDNGVSANPRWSIKSVRRGTGSEVITVVVVHFGDLD